MSRFNEELTALPMTKVARYGEWLQMVVSANAKYVTWFLSPRPMFSPSSNLIRSVAKGVAMNFRDGEWDPVLYVPPVIVPKLPKKKHHSKKSASVNDDTHEAPSIGDLLEGLASGHISPLPTPTPPPEMGFPLDRIEGLMSIAEGLQPVDDIDEPPPEDDEYADDRKEDDGNDFAEAKMV